MDMCRFRMGKCANYECANESSADFSLQRAVSFTLANQPKTPAGLSSRVILSGSEGPY